MYANVVTMDYQSPESLKTVIEKLGPEAQGFDVAPGFQAFHMVQTSPTQTVHTVVFDNEENFEATRAKMFPLLLKITEGHLTGPPNLRPGPVVLGK